MTRPRSQLISLDDTPYYHCIARCVRRAWLCGEDPLTGQSFQHRRQWVVDRLKTHAAIFCIDICAYAVMSNHYHVVLHVDRQRCEALSNDEVAERWCQLFSGPLLVQRFCRQEALSDAEQQTVSDTLTLWRQRLMDISWFMRCLNEAIAREANKEDDCKGRFWEGRFRSQALLDVPALLSCMVYVDLNPVRAGIADSLETADFTSIQERLRRLCEQANTLEHPAPNPEDQSSNDNTATKTPLLPFIERESADSPNTLPFTLKNYIALADWTGRAVRDDKPGAIRPSAQPSLDAMGLGEAQWLELATTIQRQSLGMLGSLDKVKACNIRMGRRWMAGQSGLMKIYGKVA